MKVPSRLLAMEMRGSHRKAFLAVHDKLIEVEKQRDELLELLDGLRSEAYWIVEGGEFSEWVKDKMMPLAAAKELNGLYDAMYRAQIAIAKARGQG